MKKDKNPLINFTPDFWILMEIISDDNYSHVVEELAKIESNPNIDNKMKIEKIDVSDKKDTFDIIINGRSSKVGIKHFLNIYFKNKFEKEEIESFLSSYNTLIGYPDNRPTVYYGQEEEEEYVPTQSSSSPSKKGFLSTYDDWEDFYDRQENVLGTKIEVGKFSYNPTDVKSTFISLVTQTYPHGTENGLLKYLPPSLKKDSFGNYYLLIGNSDTCFTCHLDSACRDQTPVVLHEFEKNGHVFIGTDNKTILGADDKAGCVVLMYMIHHRVPGVYWFFVGEERGGLGSSDVARKLDTFQFMKNIKKVISFDRRNYNSVITNQRSTVCCSSEFANSLCSQLNSNGISMRPDPTGIFTDSANFIDKIPECTNISVGYFDEHTHREHQNITFLEKLCKAVVKCKWDKLIVARDPSITQRDNFGYSYRYPLKGVSKVDKLISGSESTDIYDDLSMLETFNACDLNYIAGKEFKLILSCIDPSADHLYDDLMDIKDIFDFYDIDPYFDFYKNEIRFYIPQSNISPTLKYDNSYPFQKIEPTDFNKNSDKDEYKPYREKLKKIIQFLTKDGIERGSYTIENYERDYELYFRSYKNMSEMSHLIKVIKSLRSIHIIILPNYKFNIDIWDGLSCDFIFKSR